MKKLLVIVLVMFSAAAAARAQGSTSYPGSLDTSATLPAAVDQKFTYLAAAITNSATAVTVNSTAGLPSTVVAQIDAELLSCSVTNATTLTCSRGFSGTTGAAHAAWATVRFPLAAAHVNGVRGAAIAVETKLGTGASPAASASTGDVLTKQADGSTQWATPVAAFDTQTANTVFAGPASGGAAAPSFRALAEADVPALAASKIAAGVLDAARLPVASGSAAGVVDTGAQTFAGTKTFSQAVIQRTGAAASFIADRTDGKVAALGAGGSSVTLAYDSSGTFKIESNSRANIEAGVFGTGATARLSVDGSGNVGVGTASPQRALQVQGGDIYAAAAGSGLVLKSPDGATCVIVTVTNAGALSTAAVTCP